VIINKQIESRNSVIWKQRVHINLLKKTLETKIDEMAIASLIRDTARVKIIYFVDNIEIRKQKLIE